MESARWGAIAAAVLIAELVIGLAQRGSDLVCHNCCRLYAAVVRERCWGLCRGGDTVIAVEVAVMRLGRPRDACQLVRQGARRLVVIGSLFQTHGPLL